MATAQPTPLDDEAAEEAALDRALAASRADVRVVPHEEARAWFMRLAWGEFEALPPTPRPKQ